MKTLKRITLAMAIMSLIISQAYSQKVPDNKTQKDARTSQTMNAPAPGKFVDNNKDGICDNHQAKMSTGKCSNPVAKNGNGNCNQKAVCQGKGNSGGCGMGCGMKGQGKGNCGGGGCGQQHRNGCGPKDAPAQEPQKPIIKKQ
jgi:hypothetical protein